MNKYYVTRSGVVVYVIAQIDNQFAGHRIRGGNRHFQWYNSLKEFRL